MPVVIRSRRCIFARAGNPALTSWPEGWVQGNRFGEAQAWENWEIERREDASGAYANIRAWTGKYLSAYPDGVVAANKDEARERERWTLEDCEGGFTAFKYYHGMYLSNRGDSFAVGDIVSQVPKRDHWEEWRVLRKVVLTHPGQTARDAVATLRGIDSNDSSSCRICG